MHVSKVTNRGHDGNKAYVCIVGCANIDIVGFPNDKLVLGDSNQGSLQISLGGVGRNIGENLSRLNIDVELITVIGNDTFSNLVKRHSEEVNIGIEHSMFLTDQNCALHMAIMNEENDLAVALSAMSIYEAMDVPFIETKKDVISDSLLTVIDTSAPQNVIEHILNNIKGQKYFVEVDAAAKAKRIVNVLDGIYFLKLNLVEAEFLCDKKLASERDISDAAEFLFSKGVKNICISLGSKGLYIKTQEKSEFVHPPKVNIVNTNGSGDALAAGIIYGLINGFDTMKSIAYGQICAAITLQHKDTVSNELSEDMIVTLADTL